MSTTTTAEPAASTSASGSVAGPVTISQARAFSYKVPKTPSSSSRPTNYVVSLSAVLHNGREIEGLGEGQPRGWRTGDDAGDSWKFVAEAVGRLEGHELPGGDERDALDAVRLLMEEFTDRAQRHVINAEQKRPFHGTLLGLEIALLDLSAKARGITLAQLLGQKREAAPLAPPSFSPKTKFNRLRRELSTQADSYERTRLTGGASSEMTLDFLELVATVNRQRRQGRLTKPLWLDLNGALTREEASEFVQDAVNAAAENLLSTQLIIEQPVPVKYGDYLSVLQKEAQRQAEQLGRQDLDIRIAGDETIWDVHSLNRLRKQGTVQAINIRPAQAGGLLASIELAERTLKHNPDALIFLSRMPGASRITASALRHLALALPKVDAAVVASVVEKELKMTSRVKTAEELAEAVSTQVEHRAAQEADNADLVEEQLLQKDRVPAAEVLREAELVHTDSDDEPEYDDGEEPEEDAEADEEAVDDSAQTSAPAPPEEDPDEDYDSADYDSEDSEVSEDDAAQESEGDPIRRLRVRDVPGIGVELRFPGLVSDVQDAVIYPAPPETTYNGTPVTIYDDVDDLHPLGPNGSKGHLLEREALALGLSTTRFSKGAFTATDGENDPINFKWSRNPMSSAVSLALCTHKEATRMQLQRAGVPVPQGRTFASGDFETAREFVGRIGYPVVVKPAMGVRGIGVVAGIQDEEQLDSAFRLMSGSKLGGQDFIVEKHVNGADYRIVVIGEEVVAAIQREPASVFGDGKSSIAELLINKNVARKRNPHLWARPAKYDAAAQHELQKAGRDLDTVLPAGERQLLANTCSLSQGGDSIDVLDELHPSIKEACVASVKAMPGLHFCGVDFLLEDHTKPLDEQDAGVCELNAHAAIGNCEYPMFGTGRPVAKTLMKTSVDHYGLESAEERAGEVALHLTIRGRVTKVGFRRWLQRRAHISGVSGWVRNVDRRTLEAVLVGPTDPTTAVASATILGPKRALPTSYVAEHIPRPDLQGFEILEDAPDGTAVEAIDAA